MASWVERFGKLLWWLIGPTISALVVGGLGGLTYGLFYGALFGVVAFAAMQFGLTLWLFRPQGSQRLGQATSEQRTPEPSQAPAEFQEEAERPQQSNEQLKAEIEEKERHYRNRRLLKYALMDAKEEGRLLRGSDPIKPAVDRWEEQTKNLIDTALGEDSTNHFLNEDGPVSHPAKNPTEQQIRLDWRIQRLDWLLGVVDSVDPLQLKPSFKGEEWTQKRP